MDVAAALRSARLAGGLSQRGLARRTGMSTGALSRYESGRALPSLPALDRLLASCRKDVRLVVVDRVDDLDAELARRAALPRAMRHPYADFLRAAFLTRLIDHDTQVLVGGAWAADLHGIPTEAAEGRLLVADDPAGLERLAQAFLRGMVPFRRIEGHYGSLTVRPQTFAREPVAHWLLRDVGQFRTELLPVDGAWPVEQRVMTPAGALRVVAAETLGEDDGVQPAVAAAWRAMREAAGPDTAPWARPRPA